LVQGCKRVTDHILDHNYSLIDTDGKPTTWAVWSPERLNDDPRYWEEHGVNALEILSHLKVAMHIVGSPRYEKAYRDLIEKHHPSLIVVEMGDTVAGYGMPQINRPWLIEQVRTLTGKIAASRISCNWVGPMWGQNEPPYNKSDARVKEVSQLLSESVSPCRYIDSTAFARPGELPTRDGTHLQPDGYRKWSTAITDAIVRLRGQGS